MLYIFGYGTYEGDFVPPEFDVKAVMASFKEDYEDARKADPTLPELDEAHEEMVRTKLLEAAANPRIKLDNGKTVWGYECWWGDVEGFDAAKAKEGFPPKIVEIDIEAERARFREQAN